jgi:hypothetical protein
VVEAFGESWELIVLLTWASVVEVRTLQVKHSDSVQIVVPSNSV